LIDPRDDLTVDSSSNHISNRLLLDHSSRLAFQLFDLIEVGMVVVLRPLIALDIVLAWRVDSELLEDKRATEVD
jgi:hypothetical protein